MFSNKIMVSSVATQKARSRFSPVQQGLEKFSKLALAASMSTLLAACGGDGDDAVVTGAVDGNGNVIVVPDIAVSVGNASLEAGESTDISVRFTDQNNNLITESISVTFSSNCLSDERATIDGDTTTTDGTINATYTANGCSGVDVVSVSASVSDTNLQSSATLTIDPDAVLSVQFVSAEPSQLALRGVGGIEVSRITFRLVGQQSAPLVGESVTFDVNPKTGGTALAETTATSNSAGEVTAIVQSGTASTTVNVTATHDATGISSTSAGISISTGVPQSSRLSLALDVFNPKGFNHDGAEVTASIISSDQFGNFVPDGTTISFASPEGGAIPASCTTTGGRCSVTWISSDPRPANGRATIIAYTTGAEDFTDNNGNFIFDDGDIFTLAMDLDESFVDANENGMYDQGEFFYDFNNNGSYDVADGLWNGPLCQHGSLCSLSEQVGIAETATIAMATDDVQIQDLGDFPTPGTTILVPLNGTAVLGGLLLSDLNGSSLPFDYSVSLNDNVSSGSFEIEGVGDGTVRSNTTQPFGPLGVVINTSGTPVTGVQLTLSVRDDNGDQRLEAVWPIESM